MQVNNNNLQFLHSLLEASGVSKARLAGMMGCSTQNLFTYFKRDDMRLTTALEIASLLGYTLSFSLEKDRASTSSWILSLLLGKAG